MNEDDYNSGSLVVGRAVFEPRIRAYPFIGGDAFDGSDFYAQPCPMPKRRFDADEINRDDTTTVLYVDKRTHRIRYESETEHGVTIVIEPK